jgi:hypothetical protein
MLRVVKNLSKQMGDNVQVEPCTVHLKSFAWSSMFVHKIMHSSATLMGILRVPAPIRRSPWSLLYVLDFIVLHFLDKFMASGHRLEGWAFIKYLNPGTLGDIIFLFIKYFEDKKASKMRGNFHKNSMLSFYLSLLQLSLVSLVRHSLSQNSYLSIRVTTHLWAIFLYSQSFYCQFPFCFVGFVSSSFCQNKSWFTV